MADKFKYKDVSYCWSNCPNIIYNPFATVFNDGFVMVLCASDHLGFSLCHLSFCLYVQLAQYESLQHEPEQQNQQQPVASSRSVCT
jgi:hypothetical protein